MKREAFFDNIISMKNIFNKIIDFLNHTFLQIKKVYKLFNKADIPLYSANASFFLITTAIPIFMLLFSTLSIVSYVKIEDLIYHIQLLFPNLSYVKEVLTKIFDIANSLATKNIISINIITAIMS